MSNELNYPVKYAVLEVKENGEFITSEDDLVKGYIASKCYVVKTVLDYLSNGNIALKHEVVFPFKDVTYFKISKPYGGLGYRNIPLYDLSGEPYPINTIYNLFDTYEQAKEFAKEKNEERYNRMLSLEDINEDVLEVMKEKYYEDLEICEEFEEAIQKETQDIELTTLHLIDKEDKNKILRLVK